MTIKLGKKIGEGGCSEVFEWEGSQKLIKLAKANTNFEAMNREYTNNRIAWDNNLPVAQPFEFKEFDGRPGIVFERIYGISLMERFLGQAMNDINNQIGFSEEITQITARLLSEIHKISDVTLPSSQKESIKYSIHSTDYLTLKEKEDVISILDSLPSKKLLCHGDPNPGNILIRNDGKSIMIDWMNASIGNPEADLAEYIIMIRYAILPPDLPKQVLDYFDSIRETMIQTFMEEYTGLTGITYDEVVPWITPMAARKLSADAISEDEKQLLIQEIRRNLEAGN
ncbi:phosphotransferase [Chengkuizengella axinellae]|uniref:Phosphotransferase n=1 Tax=Chengkuizengella axinellae TaxID=3064388 RepID=A0ABT9IZN0_9BACL|nr:phosphotransferase [Chengkuizengella sp. 2205SS18-9]MDP5274244.1 phosphotransferase [Chengkuizengella sp. 2205SS18-9]